MLFSCCCCVVVVVAAVAFLLCCVIDVAAVGELLSHFCLPAILESEKIHSCSDNKDKSIKEGL